MRVGLRWRILLLTALPLAALTLASLFLVDRGVSSRTEVALRDDLVRAADLLERLLAERTRQLEATGSVIVRDPRFFSVLTLPHHSGDAEYAATVAGVASDFGPLSHADVFEVVDAGGAAVASVGALGLDDAARTALGRDGLAGRTVTRLVAVRGTHVLVIATPVVVDRRVAGALVLGDEIGQALAADLRELTKSDLTFTSAGRVTCTTLAWPAERNAALAAARTPGAPARTLRAGGARWLALARPLPFAGGAEGETYVLQRSFDAETAFLRDVRGSLGGLGILALLALTLAAVAISLRVTRPVHQLVAAAEAMERGDWDAPLDTERGDEMGALAARFAQMRRRQREYVGRLEELARAKSEFISVASHELRTPIAIIRGWRELFGAGVGPGDDAYAQGLDAIGHACDTLERIAVDATRMSEAESAVERLQPAWTELRPLLEAAATDARDAGLGRAVDVGVHVERGASHARLDADAVRQAIDALVRNGIRFTPDGGVVSVSARAAGHALHIDVADTGIGLSAETRARLGDRAFAPRDSAHHKTGRGLEFNRPGLGFGLVLVRRVAEGHGGALRIAGEEGRGSTFTLVLPDAIAPGQFEEAA